MAGRFQWFTKNRLNGNGGSSSDASLADEWHIDLTYVQPITSGINLPAISNVEDTDASGDADIADFENDISYYPTHQAFVPKETGWLAALRFSAEARMLAINDATRRALAREQELGNQFNFVPVILALGIGAYYTAPREPHLATLLASFAILTGLALRIRTRRLAFGLCVSLAIFVAGIAVAKLQMDRAQMPVPLSQTTGQVSGTVLSVDQNGRGVPRYLIRATRIEGLAENELPMNIRLSASRNHVALKPGDSIEGLARLQPVSGPAYPGSYDFAFSSYLEGLGLSGFFMGAPTSIDPKSDPGWLVSANQLLQHLRGNLSARIRQGLPGEPGNIATALITGDRSGLSDETEESLRRSGLAHILAISGLHMALVTLTVIWLVRLALVLVPGLADRYPIKKWAIAAGFVTATLYLFISGAGIATQRAWLMITVMLAASFMDRRALTMRSVTIAALIILILSPASVFQPGFQMSFAAVAALVVVYQDWTHIRQSRQRTRPEQGAPGWAKAIFGYFTGLSATSLVAGLATALIAMAHFHRVAPLGLVSNLAAMPLVSMLVMPLSLLSMFLMPYGFESLALAPLGKAIEGVVAVSDWVNSFKVDFETGDRPGFFLFLGAAFLVLGCFLKTRLRLLALVPLAGLVAMAPVPPNIPDMLIGQDGRSIAVRTSLLEPTTATSKDNIDETTNPDGLTLLYPRQGKFTSEIWQKAFLPNRNFYPLPGSVDCTKDRCDFPMGGKKVSVVFDPALLKSACREADLLLAPRLWWVKCEGRKPKLVISRTDLENNGAYQVTHTQEGFSIRTAWPAIGGPMPRRLWQQRFNNIERRYPTLSATSFGPPRRRGYGEMETDPE